MLKVAFNQEEREGAALMHWWAGDGAARVLAWDDGALLLERAMGERSLAAMTNAGEDDEAVRILCGAAARLHAPRARPPPQMLVSLPIWFRQLEPTARAQGGVLLASADAARILLAEPREPCVIHGDIHHDNVLDFGERGWLAIDPKGLFGERGFDHANLFCNPWPAAADAGRLRRRIAVVAQAAGLEPSRLLLWILAYAGLSAAWTIGDGGDPWRALRIAEIAASEAGLS